VDQLFLTDTGNHRLLLLRSPGAQAGSGSVGPLFQVAGALSGESTQLRYGGFHLSILPSPLGIALVGSGVETRALVATGTALVQQAGLFFERSPALQGQRVAEALHKIRLGRLQAGAPPERLLANRDFVLELLVPGVPTPGRDYDLLYEVELHSPGGDWRPLGSGWLRFGRPFRLPAGQVAHPGVTSMRLTVTSQEGSKFFYSWTLDVDPPEAADTDTAMASAASASRKHPRDESKEDDGGPAKAPRTEGAYTGPAAMDTGTDADAGAGDYRP
jgi:hypothetical protein